MKLDRDRQKVIANRLNTTHYGLYSESTDTEGKEVCFKCGKSDKEKTVDYGYIYINRSWEFKEYTLCLDCLEEIREIIGDKYP